MSIASQKNLPKKEPGRPQSSEFLPYTAGLKTYQEKKSCSGEGAESNQCTSEPSVEIVKKDGVVEKIVVTCKCGEIIEINCDYNEK